MWPFRTPLRPPEDKASRAGKILALGQLGRAVWSARDYASLAREGYAKNPVVYRCVRLIAEAASAVPLYVLDHGADDDDHPLLHLLRAPNHRQAQAGFMETVIGHLLLAGNAYLEAVSADKRVAELYALRPDRMRVVPGPDGWPAAYDYVVNERTLRFKQDSGVVPPILHLTLFHPTNDHYGLAPLDAAHMALDTLQAANQWNKALLDNAARPSGALVYAPASGASLSAEQFERLKDELETSFQGTGNAGRPLLLEGGLDWRPLSLTPKDMDFIETRNAAARDIALAFGVPPMLLGIPGDATYANYSEANRAFWRQTVLPLLNRVCQALAHWLAPAFGNAALHFDPDKISALAVDRLALWRSIADASFLSDDEKRDALGFEPRGANGGLKKNFNAVRDEKYDASQPRVPAGNADGGQWMEDGGARGAGRFRVTAPASSAQPAQFRPRGGGGGRTAARFPDATPGQQARHAIAEAHAREAVARAREVDPNFREPQSLTETIEGEIAHYEAVAKAAQASFAEVASRLPLEHILAPGGRLVGSREERARPNITTVPSSQFENLKSILSSGAREVPSQGAYKGKWFQRSDGTIFGLRNSETSGETIDIIKGKSSSFQSGFKVHQK